MKKILIFITLLFSFISFSQEQGQIVKGKVQSETSKAILQNVHVLNLTKVKVQLQIMKVSLKLMLN